MTWIQIATHVSTIVVFLCLLAIAMFFVRASWSDRLMSAMYVFFAVSAALYGLLAAFEIFGGLSLVDPIYGKVRPIVFRGVQAIASVWLVWELYRKR